ncbi:unnamed protein product [Absidia cylindrospora]
MYTLFDQDLYFDQPIIIEPVFYWTLVICSSLHDILQHTQFMDRLCDVEWKRLPYDRNLFWKK